MQDNNAKKLPKFYLVLIICWAIALALLAVALLVIRTYLADYESVQPKYVAEEVFENYFSGGDYSALVEKMSGDKSEYETDEMLTAYLAKLTEGKTLSYHNVSSGMDTTVSKYIVKYTEGEKDIKMASFTLGQTGEKSSKGFAKYALCDLELFYPTDISVSVKVTKGAIPYVNGKPLSEAHIVSDDIAHESCAHMPEGVDGIRYTLYTLDGLTTEPSVSVKDADGNDMEISFSEEENCYITELVYDEALAAEQSERVIAAAQAFATYMQNDCTIGKLTPYFEKGTDLYNSIRSTLQWAVIDHDRYQFEDVEVSEFYRYDENTFSCRVKMTHVLKRSRLEDYRDRMDATFYLRIVDGEYLVYDRTNN